MRFVTVGIPWQCSNAAFPKAAKCHFRGKNSAGPQTSLIYYVRAILMQKKSASGALVVRYKISGALKKKSAQAGDRAVKKGNSSAGGRLEEGSWKVRWNAATEESRPRLYVP